MKKSWIIGLVLLLSGCATYTLVEPVQVAVSDLYSVKPGIEWSQIKKG